MSVSTSRLAGRAAPSPALASEAVTVGLVVLAAYEIALAAFMAIAPHAFFTSIGPFGQANTHYVRDTATFSAALGVGAAVAVRRRSWRIPVLAITTVQFALHSVNHLLDIGRAHPAWTGYFDFFSLAVSTLLLVLLLRWARGPETTSRPSRKGQRR
jgi:hypothetical protein